MQVQPLFIHVSVTAHNYLQAWNAHCLEPKKICQKLYIKQSSICIILEVLSYTELETPMILTLLCNPFHAQYRLVIKEEEQGLSQLLK